MMITKLLTVSRCTNIGLEILFIEIVFYRVEKCRVKQRCEVKKKQILNLASAQFTPNSKMCNV